VLWPYVWEVMGSNLDGQRISFIFANYYVIGKPRKSNFLPNFNQTFRLGERTKSNRGYRQLLSPIGNYYIVIWMFLAEGSPKRTMRSWYIFIVHSSPYLCVYGDDQIICYPRADDVTGEPADA